MSLHQITKELRQIEEIEVHDQNSLAIQENITNLLQNKVDAVARYVDQSFAEILQWKAEIEALREMIAAKEAKIDKFNEYVALCLEHLGTKEVSGKTRKIKIRKPSKKVEIFDERSIPPSYIEIKQTTRVNIGLIKEDITVFGKEVAGAKIVDGKKSIDYGYVSTRKKGVSDEQ
jgi:hypothetical protein